MCACIDRHVNIFTLCENQATNYICDSVYKSEQNKQEIKRKRKKRNKQDRHQDGPMFTTLTFLIVIAVIH